MNVVNISETISKMLQFIDRKDVRDEISDNIIEISILAQPKELKKLLEEFIKYPDGVATVNRRWRIIYNSSKDCIGLMATLGISETVKKQMLQDVPFLIKYGNFHNTANLSRELSRFEGGHEAIAQNADELIEDCFKDAHFLAMPLLQTELGRKKLKEKFEKIKSIYTLDRNMLDFFKLIRAMKDYPEFQEEYEDYSYWADLYEEIEVPKPRVLKSPADIFSLPQKEMRKIVRDNEAPIIKDITFSKLINCKEREEKQIILKHIANGNKYQYKSHGTSSFIIQAGRQIIKLGNGRRKFEIPYHPRIMMPYFRKKYSDESCLEIFNYGITDSAKITDEKLLEIYKEFERDKIKWGDAKKENILELTEDNVVPDYVQSEDFNLFGFLEDERFPTKNHIVLKKGDLVVCDLDMLYAIDDPEYREGDLDPIIVRYLLGKNNHEGPEGP